MIKLIKEKWKTHKREEIANELGITISELYKIAKKNNLPIDMELSKRAKTEKWTENEIQYIKENYNILTIKEISKHINRSISAIYYKLKTLGLEKQTIWTNEEIKLLYKIYNNSTTEELKNNFLNRSIGGIRKKAKELGLIRNNVKFPKWTNKEKERVIELSNKGYTDKQISNILDRGLDNVKAIRRIKISNSLYIWDDKEIKLLKEMYSCKTIEELEVLFPNKNRKQINSKANIIGLKKNIETYRRCFNIKTKNPQKLKRNYIWRVKILKRDKFKCVLCGFVDKTGINLQAHHIKPVRDCNKEERKNINNGICLCVNCHKKVNGNEYEYFYKFSKLLENE